MPSTSPPTLGGVDKSSLLILIRPTTTLWVIIMNDLLAPFPAMLSIGSL